MRGEWCGIMRTGSFLFISWGEDRIRKQKGGIVLIWAVWSLGCGVSGQLGEFEGRWNGFGEGLHFALSIQEQR